MRTVVLVDDHEMFRRFARRLFVAVGYDVIGEAATAQDGLATTRDLGPDVVVLDVLLPDGTGFDIAGELATDPKRPLILLISSRPGHDWGQQVTACGADAFIAKDDLSIELLGEVIGQ